MDTCHVWAKPGCLFEDEFPTYYALLSQCIYLAVKEQKTMAFSELFRNAFIAPVKQISLYCPNRWHEKKCEHVCLCKTADINKETTNLCPLLLKQDRISLWHEQTARYASELRELKQQMVSQLENLDKEKEALRMNLDSVGTRVDRVERELDYLETQNGAQPCVDVDDKLIEQEVTLVKEKQKAKYSKLSGEMWCASIALD